MYTAKQKRRNSQEHNISDLLCRYNIADQLCRNVNPVTLCL